MADPGTTTTTSTFATLEPDGKILHFLKELPAWCILFMLITFFTVFFQLRHDDFVPRIIDGLVGAMLTALVGARPKGQPSNVDVSADTIKADSINPASMPDANITVNNDKSTEK